MVLPLFSPFIILLSSTHFILQFILTMSPTAKLRVTILGAAGCIGKAMSLLLKINKCGLISALNLYDVDPATHGIAVDLSDIPTCPVVTGYAGHEHLDAALKDADVVVVVAGEARKPGVTRDDLFVPNAPISVELAQACVKACPKAAFLIISNPVDSLVPLWSKILKEGGVYDPKKLFGVTTLDSFRASVLGCQKKGSCVKVPVVGGHDTTTIIPLFSRASPSLSDFEGQFAEMVKKVAMGGEEVLSTKKEGSTLAMAAAGACFTESVLKGLSGEKVTGQVAYVENPAAEKCCGVRFFATEIVLGKEGIAEVVDVASKANDMEKKLIKDMIDDLKAQIQKGLDYTPESKKA